MNEVTKNKWVAVAVTLVIAGLFFGGSIFYSFSNKVDQDVSGTQLYDGGIPEPETRPASDLVAESGLADNQENTQPMTITTPEGLIIEDTVVGTGAEAKAGQTILVHYSGTLTNGMKFDSSYDRGQPFQFALGAGQVIKGWDHGFAGMKVGGKRKLTIPPALAYGSQAVGGVIPANSTLVFEIELVGIK